MRLDYYFTLFTEKEKMAFLPGDLNEKDALEQIIRVNHAGEYGAKCIYAGQLAVLKSTKDKEMIKHMAAQEQVHLDYFTQEMQNRRVRPSLLLPLWHVLGYALGAGTAYLGKNAAMIATEAVEEVIDKHYQTQVQDEKLPEDLITNIEKFRQEELEHLDLAKNNMTELSFGHKLLYQMIKIGCKLSISIAKKL